MKLTGSYSETTLRLKGLDGTLLTAVDSKNQKRTKPFIASHPKTATPEIVIKRPGNSPPRFMVYLRLPSGSRFLE